MNCVRHYQVKIGDNMAKKLSTAEIEYGLKEFFQGVLVGFIIGFIVAIILL